MSVMERRLQLLLDRARFDLVEREASQSGRSVAAVIREAIDWRFAGDVERRRAAAAHLLRDTEDVAGDEPDWGETKAAIERDLARRE